MPLASVKKALERVYSVGFIVDGLAISLGGILGGIFKSKVNIKNNFPLALAIMLISAIGLLENMLSVSDGKIVGENTVIVSIALVVGFLIGEGLKLEDRLHSLPRSDSLSLNGLIDAIIFFGVGGLQISGPILYALKGDSFQLMLKGVVDFPFALMLGATYGKRVSLSSLAVVLIQLIIAGVAYFFMDFLSDSLLSQLCSVGYLILFFSGFNMICPSASKVKNINIIPAIFLIIIYNIIMEAFVK